MEWSFRDWCEFYRSIGWVLIPVKNKKALCKWGSVDPDITQYYNQDIDVAVATGSRSGIFAVDVDGVRGQENEKTKAFIKACEETKTRKFRTKSGNWQYLFKYDPSNVIANKQDTFNTKREGYAIDIRGQGGLTVIPPSKDYSWVNEEKVKELPYSILQLIQSPTVQVPRQAVSTLPESGDRHNWFMSEVASAFAKGWTLEKAMTHFCTLNKGLDDPLENVDLEGLIGRIYKLHCTNLVRKNNVSSHFSHVSDSFHNGFGELIKDIEGQPESQPEFTTGFQKLDDLIWGYSRGHLTVLSGVSEAGKSMLAQISFLRNLERGKKCLMFSAELMKKDVYKRMLIHNLKIDSDKFNNKMLSIDNKNDINNQIRKWQEYGQNMMIYADNLSPEQINGITRAQQPDIVFVDYWQNLLFEGEGHMYMVRTIEMVHKLAKDLNIPVVVLSQLHDQYVSFWNPDKKKLERAKIDSTRGDVKMSKALVQAADVLLMLNYRNDENTDMKGLRISVGKNKVTGRTRSLYYLLDTNILNYKEIEQDTYYAIGQK